MHRSFAIPVLLLAASVHAQEVQVAQVAINAGQRAALGIVTAPLSADVGAAAVGLPATVRVPPDGERVIAAPLAGMVSRVLVAPGDPLKAGQPVVILRSEELAAAQRDTAAAAVQAQLAEESARRDEALFAEGIVPESRLQATRAALIQARAQLAERRASLRLMGFSAAEVARAEQGEELSDSVSLVAPIAGTVLDVPAAIGARVDAAAPLAHIANLGSLWLEIQAPVENALRVSPGQKVAVPGTRVQGTVLVVGSSVSAAQTVLIRAQVGNPAGELRLNQQVTASIEGPSGERQWRVPIRAIVSQDGKDWVFIEQSGGFAPTTVQVLARTAQTAAVLAPFTGSERVVVEGIAAVKAAWQGMGGE